MTPELAPGLINGQWPCDIFSSVSIVISLLNVAKNPVRSFPLGYLVSNPITNFWLFTGSMTNGLDSLIPCSGNCSSV